MCNPLAIGMSMIAAGTYAQSEGAKKAQKAIGAAREAERLRQMGLKGDSDVLFKESLGKQGTEGDQGKTDKAIGDRLAAINANVTSAPTVAPIKSQGETPQVVADESAQRTNDASNTAAIEGRNKAIAAGFGDTQVGNALMNLDYSRRQNQIADFSRGSAGVLGAEVEAASHKGDSLRGWGQALTAAGSMVGMYGAMQPATAAAGTAAAGTAAAGTAAAGTAATVAGTAAAVTPATAWYANPYLWGAGAAGAGYLAAKSGKRA
jgi:hypothetical protein